MTKYQLAKLVTWTGGIDTRKRMQKLVYMLQAAGCNFSADYFLHRYGPYSQELARMTDDMVSIGLLQESAVPNQVGQRFSYALTEIGHMQLASFEKKNEYSAPVKQMQPFEMLAKDLASKDLRELEIASTIAYFHCDKKLDWENACKSACSFKGIPHDSTFGQQAFNLAKKIERS